MIGLGKTMLGFAFWIVILLCQQWWPFGIGHWLKRFLMGIPLESISLHLMRPHFRCWWCGSNCCEKKNYSFHKRKWNIANYESSISRIEKVLLEESMHNVCATTCCTMNCCQHFPCEKTLLLRQEFSSLSFEYYYKHMV
jgi:hypothetical protein